MYIHTWISADKTLISIRSSWFRDTLSTGPLMLGGAYWFTHVRWSTFTTRGRGYMLPPTLQNAQVHNIHVRTCVCTYILHTYSIALIFRRSKFSRFSRIRRHSQKYFSENFDTLHHRLLLHVHVVILQHIREIFSTKLSKTAIRENLDQRNISTIR